MIMRHQIKPFVIISAQRTNLGPEANLRETVCLASDLDKLPGVIRQPCRGVWQGIPEDSFLVWCDPWLDPLLCLQLSLLLKTYHQDCYLYVDARRQATFIDREGNETRAGVWSEYADQPTNNYTEIFNRYFKAA